MTKTQQTIGISVLALAGVLSSAIGASAQIIQRPGVPAAVANKQPQPPPPPPIPSYVIGADDVLLVTVWNEKDVSGEVKVRPDGKITLAVGNDIVAAGLTVDELKQKVTEELKRVAFEQPTVYIQVKEIKSRNVYITGAVNKPGVYALTGPMTVVQLISAAGGLQEFADAKHIRLISATLKDKDGQPLSLQINYEDLLKGKNKAKNNPELRPGDQILVK